MKVFLTVAIFVESLAQGYPSGYLNLADQTTIATIQILMQVTTIKTQFMSKAKMVFQCKEGDKPIFSPPLPTVRFSRQHRSAFKIADLCSKQNFFFRLALDNKR